eukprot:8781988-Alexandrium_andersonii.AAC.1
MSASLVGSEMCIRDRLMRRATRRENRRQHRQERRRIKSVVLGNVRADREFQGRGTLVSTIFRDPAPIPTRGGVYNELQEVSSSPKRGRGEK